MEILSPSKINLYLKVRRKRPDGYHELETLFLPLAAPSDRVRLASSPTPGIRVSCSVPGVPGNLENLAGRAALAYAEAAHLEPAWEIHIEKEIPVAAGMGGGSSNAAAVLKLLNAEYNRLSGESLTHLALTLGADVPFFLHGRLAIATGVGEIFRYPGGVMKIPPVLIAFPHFPVSAKWAYTHLAAARIGEEDSGKLERLLEGLSTGNPELVAENLHNDLAPALYGKFPLLGVLREFMLEHGALNAAITGSGPSLFAVCATEEKKQLLGEMLRANFSAISVF